MQALQAEVVKLFREEHQDWVTHINDAADADGEVDINLGGKFAERIEKLLLAFQDFQTRHNKKKGRWGQ